MPRRELDLAGDFPGLAWLARAVRGKNLLLPAWAKTHLPVLDAAVGGSLARGTQRPGSDLDLIIIVQATPRFSSLKLTERVYGAMGRQTFPCWEVQGVSRQLDFQFFYPGDCQLADYDLIFLRENRKTPPDWVRPAYLSRPLA